MYILILYTISSKFVTTYVEIIDQIEIKRYAIDRNQVLCVYSFKQKN